MAYIQIIGTEETDMKITKELAEKLGRQCPSDWSWEIVRDYVDQATDADLDCTQIDLITDWVVKARDADIPRRIALRD